MREEHHTSIGGLIANLREEQGWSQRALAKWVGIDQSAVSRIEAGRRRLSAEEIPLQSKIMSIADIYDALTARDRPYKKAMPTDKALDILGFEVKDGHIDAELVRIFREAEVYRIADRDDLSY